MLSVKSYCKEGNDQEGRKYVKELLRISKELGNKEQEAEVKTYWKEGNNQESRKYATIEDKKPKRVML